MPRSAGPTRSPAGPRARSAPRGYFLWSWHRWRFSCPEDRSSSIRSLRETRPGSIPILSAPHQRSWRLTGIAKTMQNERRLQRGCTPLFAHRAPLTRKVLASVAPPVRNALRAIAAQDACAASLTIRSEDRAITPPFTRLPASGPRGPGAGPDSKSLQLNGCSDHGANQGCFPKGIGREGRAQPGRGTCFRSATCTATAQAQPCSARVPCLCGRLQRRVSRPSPDVRATRANQVARSTQQL